MSAAERSSTALSGAILMREAARASRQWRTYGLRVAFSGALMAVVLLAIGAGTRAVTWVDPASFGSMGRNLFIGFSAVEVLIAMVLAPVMVARAVIEEREERTLDLVVLTRLTPTQILFAKISSSLLLLGTIVLGAMPILGLVMSLGGVSVVEVVAVTVDAVAALVMLGLLGGFFALFTRSQLLATLAALAWALPVFLIVPWLYVAGTAAVDGATHLSPLYGPAARGWAALLPAFAFLPLAARVMFVGARVFAMRTANVSYGRLFGGHVWGLRFWIGEGIALLVTGLTLLPVGVVASWMLVIAASSGGAPSAGQTVLSVLARGAVWSWIVLLLSWSLWVYLRLGSEWIIALDSTLMNRRASSSRARNARPPLIPGNPVRWRELRPRMFAAWGAVLVLWVIGMWGAFQSMLWLIPGGLLLLGVANVVGAWFGVAWIATGSIERERREGTLELLLTTTLSSGAVVRGKALGIALPTLPLILIGAPLIAAGVPHASLLNGGEDEFGVLVVRGLAVAIWCVAAWICALGVSMVIAARLPRARNAYGTSLGLLGGALLVPWMTSVAFDAFPPVKVACRALLPLVAVRGPWWEPLIGAMALGALGIGLLILLTVRLRTWTAAVLDEGSR